MIKDFADKRTKALFEGGKAKRFPPELCRRAQRQLYRIDLAASLDDLAVPPGHRLEALSGDRAGQHSIRINDQWRICFRWQEGSAHGVGIVDYH